MAASNGLGGLESQEFHDSDISLDLSQGSVNQMLRALGAESINGDRLAVLVLK